MSNKSSYDHYIISESENVSILIRIRDIILTLFMWIIYLYFIRRSWPFIVDFFSWAGNAFDDSWRYTNLAILPTIESYGQVAGIMTAIYLGWALYNLLRFRGRQRRKARVPVTVEELAQMYGFSPETVTSWQEAMSVVMHHDAQGHLTDVKIVR